MEIVEYRYNQLVEPEFSLDQAHVIGQLLLPLHIPPSHILIY